MGLRPTQGNENRVEEGSVGNYTFLCHLDRSEAEWEESAVSHIWRKERARYGAPSIGGGFRSVLPAESRVPHPCVARVGDHEHWQNRPPT